MHSIYFLGWLTSLLVSLFFYVIWISRLLQCIVTYAYIKIYKYYLLTYVVSTIAILEIISKI